MTAVVAVIGASGFVGSACSSALEQAGSRVFRVHAPRLTADDLRPDGIERATARLAGELRGVDAVVNCAGNPDASSFDHEALVPANAILPGVVGAAAQRAGVARYIHVSSAVVQGRSSVLDDTDIVDVLSPYAKSKADGELSARRLGPAQTTVYRPPSVHGPSRRVTRQLSWIARSPASSVARPGTARTPQTHIANVASALAFLALSDTPPPCIVHHPWEGHTTAGLLQLLGAGRSPRMLPARLAKAAVGVMRIAAGVIPRLQPYARRIELVWFGQDQAHSWLTDQGWHPLLADGDWIALGYALQSAHAASHESLIS